MTKICTAAWIHGQVQGGGFRFATLHQAKQLGLSGYVRNQDDGSVEVVACGESERVEHLLAWLRQGGRRTPGWIKCLPNRATVALVIFTALTSTTDRQRASAFYPPAKRLILTKLNMQDRLHRLGRLAMQEARVGFIYRLGGIGRLGVICWVRLVRRESRAQGRTWRTSCLAALLADCMSGDAADH